MTNILSAGQQIIVRTPGQSNDLFLCIYKPQTLFTATIDDATILKGAKTITYFPVSGSYTAVKAGMTLYIGTQPGKSDIGRVRVRSITSSVITVAIDKSIEYVDDLYLTVRDFNEAWPVVRHIIEDFPNKTSTIYIDEDIPYSNQNSVFTPVAMMGVNYAGFVDPITGTASVYFDGSSSYTVDGTAITTYAWTFASGCVPLTSSAATPATVTFPRAGHYSVELTVTNGNGKTATAHRYVTMLNRPGRGSEVPIADWTLEEITNDFNGGSVARVSVGDRADEFEDGYMVVLFSEDFYGGVQNAIGGASGREHIVFVGYVSKADSTFDWEKSRTTFILKSIHSILDNKQLFSISLQDNATPANWQDIAGMNVNRILDHYLRWHTTVLDVADFTNVQTQEGVYLDQWVDLPKGTISDVVNSFTKGKVFANCGSDLQGRLYAEVDLNLIVTGSRPSAAMTMLQTDILDAETYSEKIQKDTAWVWMGGTAYDGSATSTPFESRAPADLYAAYEGRHESIDGLILSGQDQLNGLSGLYLAKQNARYEQLITILANNMRNIDVFPQQYYNMNLAATDTTRKTVWNNKRFIPRQVRRQWKDGALQTVITWEQETSGAPGETHITPVDVPTDGDIPPTPGPAVEGGHSAVYVATQTNIGRSKNFSKSPPFWQNIFTNRTGTIGGFCLDPFDKNQRAFAITSAGIWKKTDLDTTSTTWTLSYTHLQFLAFTGKSILYGKNIKASSIMPGVVIAQVVTTDNFLYLGRSLDYGITWLWIQVSLIDVGDLTKPVGLEVSTHNANKCWSAGADGTLFVCIDVLSGFAWSVLHTESLASIPLSIVHTPHQNNATDQTVYIGGILSGSNHISTDFHFPSNSEGWTLSLVGSASTGTYDSSVGQAGNGSLQTSIPSHPDGIWAAQWDFVPPAGSFIISGTTLTVYCETDNAFTSIGDITYDGCYLKVLYNGGASEVYKRITGSIGVWTQMQLPLGLAGESNKLIDRFRVKLGMTNAVPGGTTPFKAWFDDVHIEYLNSGTATLTAPFIKKSTDGGSLFLDITPSYGGALTSLSFKAFVQDQNTIFALASIDSTTTGTLIGSTDGGSNWSLLKTNLNGAQSIYLYPNSIRRGILFLQQDRINASYDGGINISNKTGNWAVVMGATFANPVIIEAVP